MRNKSPFFLKTYFLVALITVAVASFLYVQDIIFKLEETSVMQTRIFARFSSNLTSDKDIDRIIFEEIIQKIRFPVVVTDPEGNPVSWRNIGKLDELFADDLTKEDIIELNRIIDRLDRENEPLDITYNDKILAKVHYGQDSLYKRIQFAPFFQMIVSVLFLVIGIYGYMLYRKSNENFIWAGLAKETAHQIGTPLSSLNGWLEILKKKDVDSEILSGIDSDIYRLNIIASRFNKIGSPLTLELVDINEQIEGVIDYFRKRAPSRGSRKVEFQFKKCDECLVPADRELLKWSLENLIKNSIDALKDRENGRIDISTLKKKNRAFITITDNGKGIERKDAERIFSAGFSTKEHGWGIGLPLTKKIIEEFHQGKLKLDYTMKSRGTSFLIELPLRSIDENKDSLDR
ncbi:MAG: HAMP domain-containing sensor histidine kinase [candidate division WOR-3 bacterium]|nr:HAMP domain-containing sensor histidine kinase [candidate division WOR-3 bacterium]